MSEFDEIARLRARFSEDERIALAATDGPWRHNPDKHWRKPGTSWFEEAVFSGPPGPEAICVAGTGETGDTQSAIDADHIARHDPARVLADVAAKRRLLDDIERYIINDDVASTDGLARRVLEYLVSAYAREGHR